MERARLSTYSLSEPDSLSSVDKPGSEYSF